MTETDTAQLAANSHAVKIAVDRQRRRETVQSAVTALPRIRCFNRHPRSHRADSNYQEYSPDRNLSGGHSGGRTSDQDEGID